LGVDVTTELEGMVQKIGLVPGSSVKKGELLVQLNADSELGHLHSLEAQLALAQLTYTRNKAQYSIHTVSKQIIDSDKWNVQNLQGQIAEQQAIVNKKTIRAPFSGQIGISYVNPGQYVKPGYKITSLQTLDPIYIDFYLPQQALAQLKLTQQLLVKTDIFNNQSFEGTISTIEPEVDTTTRNVLVEAKIKNPQMKLRPGMFVQVKILTEPKKKYLTLAQTAINYHTYGDTVYVVKDTGKKNKMNQPLLIANEVSVTTGITGGGKVAILKGLDKGDLIVSSGQLKLSNGSIVVSK